MQSMSMQVERARRRVLVAADSEAAPTVLQLFDQSPLDSWTPIPVENFAEARFVMQHNPCELALVHEELLDQDGEPALGWIARSPEIPVVFLTSYDAETITQAYRLGVAVCLPRDLTLLHPWLLDAALSRAMEVGDQFRARRSHVEQLQQCRRHIDRLVNLIWRTSPMEPETHWFTQRHTMERLQEEISRTQRHGAPLTLAVAEVRVENQSDAQKPDKQPVSEEPALNLDSLTSQVISQGKRRCDVAGQYGMQGFLLLMVQTPKRGGVICCKRLKQLLEKAAEQPGTRPRGPIRAYFGLATCPAEAVSAQNLLRCAEQNLETAKTGKDEGVVA
jgi:PleD family two-component response regulator